MNAVPPPPGSTGAAVNSVAMQVTPENVLQARAALLKAAEKLRAFVRTADEDGGQLIGLCGGDPVSLQAQATFARKIQEHAIKPALQFIKELTSGADQLAQVARTFGITEEQIATSFRPGTRGLDRR